MKTAIRGIDYLLRITQGIHEPSDDPQCILRVQLKKCPYVVSLGSQILHRGDLVLALHVWNERIPTLPPIGANLEWALQLRKRMIVSFKLVARLLIQAEKYARVQAVCGSSVLFSFTDHTGGMRMMQHLGFTVLPYHGILGGFGEFWENLFAWGLLWTYSPVSLRTRHFSQLQRTDIWMTRLDFVQRYGENSG